MTSTPKALKGIVFDLDGTLVDSLTATFEAFNHGFTRFGAPVLSPREIMKYFGPGEGEIFAQIVGRENADDAYEAARNYMDANLHRVPFHSGVEDLMEKLKSAGIPIAIFTGRSWNTTELILRHHRILDRFVTVVANDHVDNPKPSPDGLYLACSRLKVDPSEVLFVGDSHADILAARSAKSNGVAALWDLMASREELARYQPHHWAEKPGQVWEIWEKLQRSSEE